MHFNFFCGRFLWLSFSELAFGADRLAGQHCVQDVDEGGTRFDLMLVSCFLHAFDLVMKVARCASLQLKFLP